MADRFPLIVNAVSRKIEELVSGDNLDLTGNNIVLGGDAGAGKYLSSDGTTLLWGTPGDVYLTQTQTLENKTFTACIISGSTNTLSNIPNTALVNPGITINGSTIALGGSVTTPDNNTTYAISAQDGTSASQKILRLTSGGNAGAGVNDDVILAVGVPASVPANRKALSLFLDRSGDTVTLSGYQEDDNTVTTVQSAVGGTAQSGAITINATGSSTVSQDAASRTITINSSYVDTITRLRATTGQVFAPADFTFLDGGATTVTQGVDANGDPTITYSSTDTITRVKGGAAGTFVTGDTTITGGTNVTVSQAGNTITVASVDTNTVTRLSSGGNAVAAGDFNLVASGATSISQSTNAGVTTITISSANDDTGASLTASGGLILQGVNFRMKNYNNFSGNTLMKWDSGNGQLTNSLITDNGSTVTIDGDLVVEGTQTILNTSTLQVEDNDIELRKGNNLTGADGGITLNRTTDSSGNVTSYINLQWNETGGYWRSWDGSVEKRFVTETETQVLTNKTLTAPTLTAPILGAATATSVNGLEIASTASATIDIASTKTLDVNRDLVLTSDNNSASITVNFRQGGNVAYTSDTLATFASTTSTQMRGLVTDTTGTGRLMFNDSPTILTALNTTSSGFTLLNSGVTNVTAFGAAGIITMGQAGGVTTINQSLVVNEDLIVGGSASDTCILNATLNSENADILIRGSDTDVMHVGRGGGAVNTNTRLGSQALQNNTSGSQNTALGYQALYTNNAGASNTALGNRALRANGVGANNIAIGKDVLLVNLDGNKNIAIGNNALEQNTTGDANVCIGHYAGFDVFGSGNVLIGPADNENSGDVTFRPPSVSGDRQLVIGSGGQAWIRGDSNYDVTFNNDVIVDVDLTVKGNLNVLGTQTITESNVVRIADKHLELAYVVSRQFVATAVTGTSQLTGVTPTAGLIPGMVVTTGTAGFTIPPNTEILSVTGNTVELTNNITGSGQITISALGPSDTSAEDGGIIVKGQTDKKITWKGTDAGVTYNTWVSSENFDLASGKIFSLNGVNIADPTAQTIGPVNGTGTDDVNLSGGGTAFTLGSAVLNSSLTSVGTLSSLAVTGNYVTNNNTGKFFLGSASGVSLGGGSDVGRISIAGNDYQTSRLDQTRYQDGANGASQILAHARGTIGAPTAVQNGDELGKVRYHGHDGDDLTTVSAEAAVVVEGTVADGDVRAKYVWKTRNASGLADRLILDNNGRLMPGATTSQNLGANSLRWATVYAQSYTFNDGGGRIDYNTTANTMEFVVNGSQQAEFTDGSFVPVSSAAAVALGTNAKRWGAIRGQSLDINGATNPATIENTGGATLALVRSSKTLSFNANYSAANTHASIELTSGMDLGFYLGGSEKIRFENDGEARFGAKVRIRNSRPFLQLISSAATSNTDPRGIINFESENSDNDEDMYRINFWEGTNNGETGNSNASIRYNGSTSDGGDGAIRFCNENAVRLFSVNRLGGGNILGTLAQNSSDIRLKENITPIENALEKVNSLTGFTYTWNQEAQDAGLKGDEHDCVQVGVSAQDVQEVQPEAVKPSPVDREKYLTVQYEKLVPLLIEAIKELKEEVEELKRTK